MSSQELGVFLRQTIDQTDAKNTYSFAENAINEATITLRSDVKKGVKCIHHTITALIKSVNLFDLSPDLPRMRERLFTFIDDIILNY
jgi:hypothetical protein